MRPSASDKGKEGKVPNKKRPAKEIEQQEEEAFPRGGSDVLTPLEKREVVQQAKESFEQDVAAGVSGKKAKKAKAAGAGGADDGGDSFLRHDAVAGKLGKFVEQLKFKNLSPGLKLWGLLLDVSPRGLTVSLPHGLRGHVAPSRASDVLAQLLGPKASKAAAAAGAPQAQAPPSLPDLFHVGQFVRCVVVGLGDSAADAADESSQSSKGARAKHVELSLVLAKGVMAGLGPEAVVQGAMLPACVKSVEDHGCVLTFGIKGVSGFLRRADHEAVFGPGSGAALRPGSLLEVAVLEAKDLRHVRVTTDPQQVSSAVLRDAPGLGLGSLLPGSLVPAKVKAVVGDGLMLSFLNYFHGTVDSLHLMGALPPGVADWKQYFQEDANKRVKARLLYVDPSTKRVGLSLLPHLLGLRLPSPTPMLGQRFEAARVAKVEAGLGLMLTLPLEGGESCGGFAHLSNLSDERVEAVEKKFQAGQKVAARVIGFRLVDGLATCSLKQSVLDAEVTSYQDCHPGMPLGGTVAAIDDYGLLVQVSPSMRALVPVAHLSDIAGVAPAKATAKFKVGQKVSGRVLEVSTSSRKLLLTLKPGLLSSKLPPLAALGQATPGRKAHGVVTGVQDYGVFVSFYGGLRGMVHQKELGLAAGKKPQDVYTVGQLLKIKVASVEAVTGRLRLSLATGGKKAGAEEEAEAGGAQGGDPLQGLQPGDLVEGAITQVQESGGKPVYLLHVSKAGAPKPQGRGVAARLEAAHLADHPLAVEALREVALQGASLGPFVVLERQEGSQSATAAATATPSPSSPSACLRLSRKASLVAAARGGALPKAFEEVKEAALLPGYVASVTSDAVFVRFLAHVTGRAGLAQLSDTFVSDPRQHYSEGQSVRAQVTQVDAARQRFALTLKPSLTASSDASYLQGLLRDLDLAQQLKAAAAQAAGEAEAEADWEGALAVGGLVAGVVHEVKDFGTMVDLEANQDVVGHLPPHQLAQPLAPGQAVQARVLDVDRGSGVLDLSTQPSQLEAGGAKGRKAAKAALAKLKPGSVVEAVVELVKPGYAVLSLAGSAGAGLLALAATTDFNMAREELVKRRMSPGQRVAATLQVLPSTPSGRLLAHVSLTRTVDTLPRDKAAAGAEGTEGAGGAGGGAAVSQWRVGGIVSATVTGVQPSQVDVQLGRKVHGRVFITEALDLDESCLPQRSPLDLHPVQGVLEAVVLGRLGHGQGGGGQGGSHHGMLELSTKASAIKAAKEGKTPAAPLAFSQLQPGGHVLGWVQEVADDHLWLLLSPAVRGRVHVLDASEDPQVLSRFTEVFKVGMALSARVLQVNSKRRQLDLSLVEPHAGHSQGAAGSLKKDTLVMGQLGSRAGAGLVVKLGHKRLGKVALTDIHDVWVPNALAGLEEGRFVRCRVLDVQEGGAKATLSLRPSRGGAVAGLAKPAAGLPPAPEAVDPSKLKEGDMVQAYAKRADSKGLFVCMDRSHDALIKLSQLSDGFIEDPAAAFPPGTRVEGRVVSVQEGGSRVQLSLRAASAKSWRRLEELQEGEVVAGRVRRVEKYGVFVEVAGSSVVGLAHISELADGAVKDINALFRAKQTVRAKVLKVDLESGKLSLGLKPSYFEGLEEEEEEEEGGQGRGAKRAKRAADLDEEMADVAGSDDDEDDEDEDGSDDADEAASSDEDGSEEEEEEEEGGSDDEPGSVDDVDDVSSDGEDDASGSGSEEEGAGRGPSAMAVDDDDDDAAAAATRAGAASWAALQLAEDLGPKGGKGGRGDDEDDDGGKLSKRGKKRAREEKEKAIRQAELARLQGGSAPQSIPDFEALVLSSPSSSFVWIRYMAFLIGLGDVEQARKVAERALKTINYRDEGEKFNVWVAWLNLEAAYGSPAPSEALMALFARALQYCDQKKLYMALLGILERGGLDSLMESSLKAMAKKFGGSCKVWLRYIEWALCRGDGEAARKLLERALSSLPARKHIKAITRTALLEFRKGSAERGRGVMEGLLRNYPKRLDLWSLYIDQEVKAGDQGRIRALFERATSLSLPPKKMKLLFKRWMSYEKEEGDAAAVEHVKRRAMEFVEANVKA